MSVLPGQLRIAENAILIDSREDLIDGSARRGVILQHPQMRDRSSPQEVARISAGQLATLVARAEELAGLVFGRWCALVERQVQACLSLD